MTLNYVNPGAQTIPPGMYLTNPTGQAPQWNTQNSSSPHSGYYGQNMAYGYQAPQYPQQAPSYSAVKIDINGATIDSGQRQPNSVMPMYPGRAQMMNAVPQYMPPQQFVPPAGNMPAPQYIMPQQAMGAATVPQFTPQQHFIPQQINPSPVPPPTVNQQQAQQSQIMQQQPVQQLPYVAPVPLPVMNQQPVQPAGVMPNAQQQQPNTAANQATPTPPPPAIDQTANQQPANETQQTGAEQKTVDPSVKPLSEAIKTLTTEGQQPSFAEQDQAIRTIAQYAQTFQAANDMIKADPENSTAQQAKQKVDNLVKPMLIDEKVFKGLADISKTDTSALSGEEKQKAEENKKISMWTLAILQKIFREEVNKELAKDNIPPMSIGEIPGVDKIVDNVKSDPNPEIREAGIVALMEVFNPENQKDVELMKVILKTAAEQDSSKNVKTVAQSALNELPKK